ncbi:MAG: hypothetical protein ABIY37_02730, partial [Devosia sp.]
CPACGTDRIEIRTSQPPATSAGAKDTEKPHRHMRPARPGEGTLGQTQEPWIIFECSKCGRRGEHRPERLIEEFGTEVQMPSLLAVFAHSRGCDLAIPHPTQFDLTRNRECLIRYDVDGAA